MTGASLRFPRRLLCIALLTVAIAVLPGCHGKDADDETATAPAPPSSRTEAVTLDAATNGIMTEPVAATTASLTPSLSSYGTVLDVTDLAVTRGQLETARAQRRAAAARTAASAAELKRVELLYADDRNLSARAVEDARGTAVADRAAVESAAAVISATEASLGQRWGAVVGQAVVSGAGWTHDLIARRAVLIEVALPAAVRHPSTITLHRDDGGTTRARFVAASPRMDPRLQRPSLFYIADDTALPTGMTLPVIMPGAPSAGSLIPLQAVVWHDGAAAVFVEQSPGKYLRTRIDTSQPVADGYLDASIAPGTRVVTRGAEQLLSEQNKPAVTEED